MLLRERHEIALGKICRHRDDVAHLAIDLHRDLERVMHQERGVGLGPGLLPQPLAAERRPQLLGDVRRVGLDQRDQGRGREPDDRGLGVAAPRRSLVEQLHGRGDGGVEVEALCRVASRLVDRPVRLARQREAALAQPGGRGGRGSEAYAVLGQAAHHRPQALEKPVAAGDAAVGPLGVVLGRAQEQHVEAQRVRAVAGDQLVGRDHVALRLGHLGAVLVDHALREQALEGLLEADQPGVVEHLREEARVEQVQDRVLDAADVLVDGQPAVDIAPLPGVVGVVRVDVADVVPGRAHERVHRVRLALRGPAALRARHVDPVRGRRQRRLALGPVVVDLGQQHRAAGHPARARGRSPGTR